MSSVVWTVFETAVSVFESFILIRFVCSFLKNDMKYRHRAAVIILGSLCFTVLGVFVERFASYSSAWGFIYAFYLFIFELIFLRGRLGAKFFTAVIADAVVLGTNIAVVSAYTAVTGGSAIQIYTQPTNDRVIVLILVQALRAYAFEVILRLTKRTDLSLNAAEWALIVSVPVISFILMWLIQSVLVSTGSSGGEGAGAVNAVLFMSQLGLVVINVVCVYTTILLNRNRKKAEELAAFKQQEELKAQYAENVRSRYEEMRRIRHDLKQSYTVIGGLLAEGKYDEAADFVRKNQTEISAGEVIIDVGNDFVNAILNSKLSIAKQKGIEVICSSTKELSGISEIDLCNLLGNLLDNAIEAAEKCGEGQRLLELDIAGTAERLVVTCSNSVEGSVELSTKKPGEHGIGIVSIKRIVRSYRGSVDYFEEDGILTCKVVVYGGRNTQTKSDA